MAMNLRRVLLIAVVVLGAVLVPATAPAAPAHSHAKIRLALVPLQTDQLGRAGRSLSLAYGSGTTGDQGGIVLIEGAPRRSGAQAGHTGGYALDYGDPYTGSTGVTEIRSSVQEYKTPAAAKKGLALARLEEEFLGAFLGSPGVDVSVKRVQPVKTGERRFGYLITESAPNLNPVVKLDEQILAGRFVLDLTITAGSASEAEHIAPHLLLLLHHRLFLMLTGQQAGEPANLPPDPQAGQAPGGPDLSTTILQPTDVGQSHAVNLFQGYAAFPPALSSFIMVLEPAGSYDTLEQQIGWWPTATEATYAETYGGGGPFALGFLFSNGATPVDLSAVGDSATGWLDTEDGQSSVGVTLTNGQAGETIFASSESTLQPSDVQSLAQAAANRLDAGLGP